MRDALGVVLHGRRQHIEPRLVDRRFVDDLLPAAEADLHVRFHRVVAFHCLRELWPVREADDIPRD